MGGFVECTISGFPNTFTRYQGVGYLRTLLVIIWEGAAHILEERRSGCHISCVCESKYSLHGDYCDFGDFMGCVCAKVFVKQALG